MSSNALCGGVGGDTVFGLDLITLTLHAEATTVLALSEARQNISKPWPYLGEGNDTEINRERDLTIRAALNMRKDAKKKTDR